MPYSPRTYTIIIHSGITGPARVVQFGDVTVVGPELTPEQRARNARESTESLKRALKCLVTPGVKIERRPGVSLVYANKNRSGTVIRELDGRKDIGILLQDGTFQPLGEDTLD